MNKINYGFILFNKKRSNVKKTHIYQLIKHNNIQLRQIIHKPNMVINCFKNISKQINVQEPVIQEPINIINNNIKSIKLENISDDQLFNEVCNIIDNFDETQFYYSCNQTTDNCSNHITHNNKKKFTDQLIKYVTL